jgi:hypothetical protein
MGRSDRMRMNLILTGIILLTVRTDQSWALRSEPLIIDHTCIDITAFPLGAILQAKATLHIAYGHTSHGSQITSGMSGLVRFANGGGKGLSMPKDIFDWNHGGSDGALDLHDYGLGGDVGYYPQWVDETRRYLSNPLNANVNVIMWSWCSQVSQKYANGQLLSEYLEPMGQLENEYPKITFVYMTGHVDLGADPYNKAANQIIRNYCLAHNKVLYDFADIESYDPDGHYYPFAKDNCEYYETLAGGFLGNWAREWQDSHTVNVDWYVCDSAHSEPLNANQKAYAAWWLFARLGGWSGTACRSNTTDLNGDGEVNFNDLAILSQHWLEGQ